MTTHDMTSFVKKALLSIEEGDVEEFLRNRREIYWEKEEYEEPVWRTPSHAPGEIFLVRDDYDDGSYIDYYITKTRYVKEKYLNTIEDVQDFLNYALIFKQKSIIEKIFQWECLNQSTRSPILFSREMFVFYAPDGMKTGLHSFDKLFVQLSILRHKIIDLDKRGHKSAASHAYELAFNLQKEMLTYIDGAGNQEELGQFKTNCQQYLEAAEKSDLAEHRGWNALLTNIGLAILGVGILYLAAATVNYFYTGKKHFFFHPETATETIIGDTKKEVLNFNGSV